MGKGEGKGGGKGGEDSKPMGNGEGMALMSLWPDGIAGIRSDGIFGAVPKFSLRSC